MFLWIGNTNGVKTPELLVFKNPFTKANGNKLFKLF